MTYVDGVKHNMFKACIFECRAEEIALWMAINTNRARKINIVNRDIGALGISVNS